MQKRNVRFVLLVTAAAATLCAPLLRVMGKPRPLASSALAAAADEPVYKAPTPPPASQPAVDPAKTVLTVGDEKVTAGDFNSLVADLPPQTASQILARPEGKRQLADELVNMKLLSDEARRRKLDESPKTRLLYQQVLAQALMQSLSSNGTDDEKFFNENKAYFDQVKARHILIATGDSVVPAPRKLTDAQAKAKAEAIKARLDKGEDFAAIARAESDDTGSGADGGDLGIVTRGKMVGPFEQATFALKKGETSGPVRTQYGYHIIQATDRSSPTFEEAKRRVSQRRFEMQLDELKKANAPVYDDAFFGKKPEAATQPTTQPEAPATTPAPASPTSSPPSSTPVAK